MNAPDLAFRKAIKDPEEPQPVDFVFWFPGGASGGLTTIINLQYLQKLAPRSLIEYQPYILGDSVGALIASMMAAPSPNDPTKPCVHPSELLQIFEDSSYGLLSPKNKERYEALFKHLGKSKIGDALTPITISATNIAGSLHPEYFTHFPDTYQKNRPLFELPPSSNAHETFADASMSSSAFASRLGDHFTASGGRYMDMAFVEDHTINIDRYVASHHASHPERRLVCIVFGNNYYDFHLETDEPLTTRGLAMHQKAAVQSFIKRKEQAYLEYKFGAENVFDLSLWIPQEFSRRKDVEFPDPFNRTPHANAERKRITRQLLAENEGHHLKLLQLGNLIRQNDGLPAIPSLSADFSAQDSLGDLSNALPYRRRDRIAHAGHEFSARSAPLFKMVGQTVAPVAERAKPVVTAGAHLLEAGVKVAGKWLGGQLHTNWDKAAPAVSKALGDAGYFLMHGEHASRAHARGELATRPSQSRSSEQHTPSEFEHKLP